jgi:hypothetical protein
MIAPGFVLIGAGLLMMRGINVSTGWTHLIPGFVLTGLGAGLVNTPLASTAVGVVDHTRAGMASGINSTLRQVGTATGVAALGSLLATQSRSVIVSDLAHTPLARSARAIAAHITSGGGGTTSTGGALNRAVAHAAKAGFVSGLNEVTLIAAVLAFVGAVFSFVLIRQRDFVQAASEEGGAEGLAAA